MSDFYDEQIAKLAGLPVYIMERFAHQTGHLFRRTFRTVLEDVDNLAKPVLRNLGEFLLKHLKLLLQFGR